MFEQTFQVRFNGRWSFQTCLEFDAIKLICTCVNVESIINSLQVAFKLCSILCMFCFVSTVRLNVWNHASVSCLYCIKLFKTLNISNLLCGGHELSNLQCNGFNYVNDYVKILYFITIWIHKYHYGFSEWSTSY